MVRKEEDRRRGRGTGWDGAAGEIHRRNFSDLLSSHLLHRREREGSKEGELPYFFVVLPHVKFVGSSIHTGNSGLCIDLHSTSLALFLFRHSLGRRVRREISKISSTARRLLSEWVIESSPRPCRSQPNSACKSNLPNPALKARNASSSPSRPAVHLKCRHRSRDS